MCLKNKKELARAHTSFSKPETPGPILLDLVKFQYFLLVEMIYSLSYSLLNYPFPTVYRKDSHLKGR